jgi:DNA-binding NarL/FixJ family response regulator
LAPDVILMDISMPVLDGIDATRAIHAEFPAVRVIGLSMFEVTEQPAAMREAGAVDYLSKSDSVEALLAAIRGGGESER